MVDTYGRWTEGKDYNTYPKEKWCDYDYMAAWIRSKGYEVKTSMKNLISMILAYYDEDEKIKERGFFAIEDERKYPDCLMVNIPDVEEFVFASGGISEFDYEG